MVLLKGADKYKPEKLPQLEADVDAQIASGVYNLDSNLALLRHYQFSPSAIKLEVLAKVLLAALTQLPSTDYKMCLHLVPEKLQAEEPITKVMALAAALEGTRFTAFWELAAGSPGLLTLVPGFEAAVRKYVLHVLGLSFQRVGKALLAENLSLNGAALDELINKHVASSGWSVAGDLITLPRNESNSPVVVKRTQEAIKFDQVAPVLQCVTIGL